VVNLAARLSDAAGPGETLVDARTIAEAQHPPETAERSVVLKGYDAPVAIHVLA
jgi:class 3 adenylate cyclase